MGFFYKILRSDIFVLSHNVQFSKSGMHNYNYIKGPQGKQKITLPVTYGHDALIKDVRIFRDEKQIQKIYTAIEQYYGKAPFFADTYTYIQALIRAGLDLFDYSLAEFNVLIIKELCKKFGISTEFWLSRDFPSKKDTRIIEMCLQYRGDTYLSGSGAAAYHDPDYFEQNGIKLVYSDYTPPVYPQRYGEFIPNLSVLDWIFNMGFALPEGWLK